MLLPLLNLLTFSTVLNSTSDKTAEKCLDKDDSQQKDFKGEGGKDDNDVYLEDLDTFVVQYVFLFSRTLSGIPPPQQDFTRQMISC